MPQDLPQDEEEDEDKLTRAELKAQRAMNIAKEQGNMYSNEVKVDKSS